MPAIRTGLLLVALAGLPASGQGQAVAPTSAYQCNAGVDYAMQSTGFIETGQLDYAVGLPKANECVRLFATDATVFGKRADVYRGLGDYERAAADLTRAWELDRENARWLTTRGDVRAQAGQDDLALADYEAALRVDAADSMALLGRAHARRYLRDLTGSIADYDAVLARIDEDDEVYLAAHLAYQGLGFARLANGEPGPAAQAFTQALERDPGLDASYDGRSQALEQTGNLAQAVADLSELLDLVGPDARFLERRGHLLLELGNRDAGVADLREALRLDPTLAAAQARLTELERSSEAPSASPVQPDGPRTAQEFAMLGRRLASRFEYDAAIAAFSDCIRLKPDDAVCLAFRGSIYGLQGRTDASKADFAEAIRLMPNEIGIYGLRGMMFVNIGRRDDAISDFRQILRIDPSNQQARQALEQLGVDP